jgi:predicted house-cleaning NTP pyrophosphatase (Maf/HAM1 superfamily)
MTEPPWEALRNGVRLLRLAGNQFAKNPSLLEIRLTQMESMLLEGSSAATGRQEAQTTIRELIQEKTRTAAAEWKRLSDLQGVITADRAMAFVESILRAARDVINDQSQLRALQRRVLQLLPGREQAVVIESTAEVTPEVTEIPTAEEGTGG